MMNRPEHAFYNYGHNAASAATTTNESTEGNFAETSEKLPAAIINPMHMLHNNAGGHDATTNHVELPMPKRNLSSYNLFFQLERENIIKGEEGMNYSHENIARIALRHYQQGKMDQPRRKHRKTHGKISFAELARSVAHRWKMIDPSIKEMFDHRTNIEKARYQTEIAEWADRKLRATPQSPKSETQQSLQNSSTIVDIFRPDFPMASDGVTDERTRMANQLDVMLQPEATMPHRVFPPLMMTSQGIQSQPLAHGNTTFDVDTTRYVDIYSQFPPAMGWANQNTIYDLTQRQQNMASAMNRSAMAYPGDGFAAQMQQYQQMNFQPFPTAEFMTLQHQFGMMVDRQELAANAQGPSITQSYPLSLSMRTQSTVPEHTSTLQGDGFAPVPNGTYTSNETLQHNVQYQPVYGTIPSQRGIYVTGQEQTRNDAKADDNQAQDLQRFFNSYEGN